ncbi:hypothetical protein TWF506_005516 [Arthrobotrys conoides]|uniref:Uncharacterized protein n=1 Tax=Arthrobotrys conoides TaxID=74498 RepID=A0AAN8NTR6_9PEZI
MNSEQPVKDRDWYKTIEKEFIKRGAPNNEETTSKARCMVGRVRKEHPSLAGLVALIKHEKKKQRLKAKLQSKKTTQLTKREAVNETSQ